MNPFEYYSPTKFVFGENAEEKIAENIKQFGGSKVLVLYTNFTKKSGLMDKVTESIKAKKMEFVEFGPVMENPTDILVYEGIELTIEEDIDFILAVGGGSAIDAAKAIAMGAVYEGDFWDFFSGQTPLQALPIGTVLTVAASGSEGSPNAIITNTKNLDKNSAESDLIRPKFAIMNPALTTTLNPYRTACGVIDIFSHCLERYFTNTEAVQLTDRMLEGVMATLVDEGRKVMANPEDYDTRATIMWAGTLAHNEIFGVGRVQDWNTHHLEHVLSAKYDCAHGAGIAVIFPAWMRYVVERHGVMRFAQFANRVFGIEMDFQDPKNTAMKGIEAFEDFIKDLDLPLNFKELGIPSDEIDELVRLNRLEEGKTKKGFYPLDKQSLKDIYEIAVNNRL